MSFRRGKKEYGVLGPSFGAVPTHIQKSDAWRWLPPFARCAVLALASKYNKINNGNLDIPGAESEEYGLSRDQLYIGLRLAIWAKLIVKTCEARGRSGKGKPAKYRITWLPLNEFPTLQLEAQKYPTDEWLQFKMPCPPIVGLRKAKQFLQMNSPP